MVMWMLSKCVHIAGVGFASRPCANVSQASRKLKSSGTNGSGTGKRGRIARRSTITLSPTLATASPFLCASFANRRSMRANHALPRRGNAKTNAVAMAVMPHSRISSSGLVSWAVGSSISVRFRPCGFQQKHAGDHRDSTASTCARQPRIQPPEPLSSPWNHASIDWEIEQWLAFPPISLKERGKGWGTDEVFCCRINHTKKAGCLRGFRLIQPLSK